MVNVLTVHSLDWNYNKEQMFFLRTGLDKRQIISKHNSSWYFERALLSRRIHFISIVPRSEQHASYLLQVFSTRYCIIVKIYWTFKSFCLCNHLYHFFPASIHSLQCLHCLLQQVLIEHFFSVFPCNAVIACYIGCGGLVPYVVPCIPFWIAEPVEL